MNVSLSQSGFRYTIEDDFVSACDKKIFCTLLVKSEHRMRL